MEPPGHIQAGGKESGAEWVDAVCVLSESEIALRVGETEVVRLERPSVEFVETGPDVFSVEGVDEALFFHPTDRGAFDRDLRGESTAADRIALASAKNTPPQFGSPTGPPMAVMIQRPPKSRTTAGILALFLGGLGIHKFYLGQTGPGVIYLVFFWTFIPAIIAFVEGLIYLFMSDEEFARKYG